MLKQMISEEEAIAKLREMGQRIFGKRWMVSVWEVEEDKDGSGTLSFVGRVTWRFPVEDFAKSLEMLEDDLKREANATKPPVPEPLDVADWLKPRASDGASFGGASSDGDLRKESDVEIDELFNPPEGEGR